MWAFSQNPDGSPRDWRGSGTEVSDRPHWTRTAWSFHWGFATCRQMDFQQAFHFSSPVRPWQGRVPALLKLSICYTLFLEAHKVHLKIIYRYKVKSKLEISKINSKCFNQNHNEIPSHVHLMWDMKKKEFLKITSVGEDMESLCALLVGM